MRIIQKKCPACQNDFEAKRKNQIYCSPYCREDTNNGKLKAKYQHLQTLEKEQTINDQYKLKFKNAIRIIAVEYDENGQNEEIAFEGKRFKKDIRSSRLLRPLGLSFCDVMTKQSNFRIAVYIPDEKAICIAARSSSFSPNDEIVYRLISKQKKLTP
ncbi:hypothetical protein LV89_04990 [Arcicella aurantiaca]|uniref:Uncharacterized protein n=1 Tax=Arcicella aurantiaca TaxID=591202 RepID=A0A316DBT5_9BACT|nr:hypothetical protein [Arcicella aurantiaca]PWK15464.1 hypothetical protein LV89_04990 [Arcicella aurantiaca]